MPLFLALDSPAAYGHVGSVSVLDPPGDGEALTLERLTELIESRLHLIPPFRRRLVEVPFGLDKPYWIEDPDFDIEFHVRELALPTPGMIGSWPFRQPACTRAPWTAAVPYGRPT